MKILFLLIPLVLIAVAVALRLLYWAVNSGQYDDLDKESRRILFDDPADQQTDATQQEAAQRRVSPQKHSEPPPSPTEDP